MEAALRRGENPLDCPVCLVDFNDTMQRPRTLPCGHTICTPCLEKLKELGRVTCPECRVHHVVPEGGEFPVSYIAEALMRAMRDAKVAALASVPPHTKKRKGAARAAGKKKTARLSKKMCSFLEEQEATVKDAIAVCQEVESQLDQYRTTLTGWGEQQQQLEDRLRGLMEQSGSVKEIVEVEKTRVAAKEKEVKKGKKELQVVLETLYAPATDQEAGMAVTETVCCLGEAEQVVEECREGFPDAGAVTTVWKVKVASSAAMEAAQAVLTALKTVTVEVPQPQSDSEEPNAQLDPGEARAQSVPEATSAQSDPEKARAQSDLEKDRALSDPEEALTQSDLEEAWDLSDSEDANPDSTIMDRLHHILSLNFKAKDLRSLIQPVRSLLQAGLVFAVHQVEGQHRYARISLEAGQLYLHALKEQPLPLGAATLQVSEVVPPSPPCTVFLDLSRPGSATQRVQIRLNPNTALGKHVLLLCTGQCGHSYLNTCLLGMLKKGEPGECVVAGGYRRNDGKGSSVLLPDHNYGEYRMSGQPGDVGGLKLQDANRLKGLFYFITKTGNVSPHVFGEVVEGLPMLVEVAQLDNIREVTVVDCGVVL